MSAARTLLICKSVHHQTGGINRRHPDEQDLRRADEFADRMQLAMRTQSAHKSLIEQPIFEGRGVKSEGQVRAPDNPPRS
jgi:hypothetical protein